MVKFKWYWKSTENRFCVADLTKALMMISWGTIIFCGNETRNIYIFTDKKRIWLTLTNQVFFITSCFQIFVKNELNSIRQFIDCVELRSKQEGKCEQVVEHNIHTGCHMEKAVYVRARSVTLKGYVIRGI